MPDETADKPVRFRAEAKLEALEAFNWYEERDPDVADRFDEQLRHVISRITRHPHLNSRYPGQSHARFSQLRGFPYLVIYRELENEIEVIAVAHAKRQPHYWDARLRPEDEGE